MLGSSYIYPDQDGLASGSRWKASRHEGPKQKRGRFNLGVKKKTWDICGLTSTMKFHGGYWKCSKKKNSWDRDHGSFTEEKRHVFLSPKPKRKGFSKVGIELPQWNPTSLANSAAGWWLNLWLCAVDSATEHHQQKFGGWEENWPDPWLSHSPEKNWYCKSSFQIGW